MVWPSGRNTGPCEEGCNDAPGKLRCNGVSKCSACATAMLTVNADAGSEKVSGGRCKHARRLCDNIPPGRDGDESPRGAGAAVTRGGSREN